MLMLMVIFFFKIINSFVAFPRLTGFSGHLDHFLRVEFLEANLEKAKLQSRVVSWGWLETCRANSSGTFD